MTLAKAETILQQRTQTILGLIEQTEIKVSQENGELTGTIHLGYVKSTASAFIMELVKQLQTLYPNVAFDI